LGTGRQPTSFSDLQRGTGVRGSLKPFPGPRNLQLLCVNLSHFRGAITVSTTYILYLITLYTRVPCVRSLPGLMVLNLVSSWTDLPLKLPVSAAQPHCVIEQGDSKPPGAIIHKPLFAWRNKTTLLYDFFPVIHEKRFLVPDPQLVFSVSYLSFWWLCSYCLLYCARVWLLLFL